VQKEVKVNPKKESTPKHKKEKAAPAPKPTSTPESVDEEVEPALKPKAKNAMDLLLSSPMVLDNWKHLYSNTKAKDFHLAISSESFHLC
jgi:elongation factor 1-gamma